MTRECIHGNTLDRCPICKHVSGLMNQNTMVGARAHMITFGIRNPNFQRAMQNVIMTRPNSENGVRRITITPSTRQSARAYINNPSMQTAIRLRESLLIAITPQNNLLNFSNSGSYDTTSRTSTVSGTRFSRSAMSVYSRLGTPDSPTTNRRVRSTTPVSRLRPRSPSNSNENDVNRFSPPRPKRPRKSK